MTRRQFVRGLALLAACAIAAPAAAENYISLAIGQSKNQDWRGEVLNFDGSVSNIGDENTARSLRFALGFPTTDYLALEIAYLDLGEVTAEGTSDGSLFPVGGWPAGPVGATVAVDGLDLGLVGRMPVSETFALFARTGVFLWEVESTTKRSNGNSRFTDDGDDLFFGLGAEFSLNPSVSFRGEFTRYAVDDADYDSLSLSAILRFED